MVLLIFTANCYFYYMKIFLLRSQTSYVELGGQFKRIQKIVFYSRSVPFKFFSSLVPMELIYFLLPLRLSIWLHASLFSWYVANDS